SRHRPDGMPCGVPRRTGPTGIGGPGTGIWAPGTPRRAPRIAWGVPGDGGPGARAARPGAAGSPPGSAETLHQGVVLVPELGRRVVAEGLEERRDQLRLPAPLVDVHGEQ